MESPSSNPAYSSVSPIIFATILALCILQSPILALAPDAPTTLTVQGSSGICCTSNIGHVTDHTPHLEWNFSDPDPGDTQGAYEVEVWTSSGRTGTTKWDTGKVSSSVQSTTYTGTVLMDSISYYFNVRTWDNNDAGPSPWIEKQFRMNSPPSAPTGLSPTARQTSNSISFTWDPSADMEGDSITYHIQVEETSSTSACPSFTPPYYFEASGLTVTSTPAQPTTDGRKYCYQVRAFDSWEYSGWSSVKSAI